MRETKDTQPLGQGLFQQAKPVFCGQSWLGMANTTGSQGSRTCDQCQHAVVNVAVASDSEIAAVQARLAQGERACVVSIPTAVPSFLDAIGRFSLNAAACIAFLLLLLATQAKGAQVPDEEFPLDRLNSEGNPPISPMIMSDVPEFGPRIMTPTTKPGLSTGEKIGQQTPDSPPANPSRFSARSCESQLFVPMMVQPEAPCTDEKGQPSTFGAWRDEHEKNGTLPF